MGTVVIDTNIFISALNKADTPPRQLLRLCLQQKLRPVMGAALFAEHEDVLRRENLFKDCPLNAEQRQRFFADFTSVCTWVSVYYLWRPNLRDEADNHVMELAMAANAGHIITGNTKDFKSGELLFPSINITTPRDFLNQWKET